MADVSLPDVFTSASASSKERSVHWSQAEKKKQQQNEEKNRKRIVQTANEYHILTNLLGRRQTNNNNNVKCVEMRWSHRLLKEIDSFVGTLEQQPPRRLEKLIICGSRNNNAIPSSYQPTEEEEDLTSTLIMERILCSNITNILEIRAFDFSSRTFNSIPTPSPFRILLRKIALDHCTFSINTTNNTNNKYEIQSLANLVALVQKFTLSHCTFQIITTATNNKNNSINTKTGNQSNACFIEFIRAIPCTPQLKHFTIIHPCVNDSNSTPDIYSSMTHLISNQFPRLQSFTWNHSHIGTLGCQTLFHGLLQSNNNDDLIHLNLNRGNIGMEGAKIVSNFLLHNGNNLQQLDLEYNFISDEGCIAIAQALLHEHSTSSSLKRLNLFGCCIREDGAKAMAIVLEQSKLHHNVGISLKHLDLGNNGIGNEGCSALANALCTNQTLTSLRLDNCAISEDGFQSLARAIKHNKNTTNPSQTRLEQLDVSYNWMGNDGAISMAKALRKNNRYLRVFHITGCNILTEGWMALDEMMRMNYTLLDLGEFPLYEYLPETIQYNLRWNMERPVEAEAVKTGIFPHRCLIVQNDEDVFAMPSWYAQVIVRVVQYRSWSVLFSLIRERPTFFDHVSQ